MTHYECDLPEPTTAAYGDVFWPLDDGDTFYRVGVDDLGAGPRAHLGISTGQTFASRRFPLGVGETLGRMLIAADLEARRQAEASGGAE